MSDDAKYRRTSLRFSWPARKCQLLSRRPERQNMNYEQLRKLQSLYKEAEEADIDSRAKIHEDFMQQCRQMFHPTSSRLSARRLSAPWTVDKSQTTKSTPAIALPRIKTIPESRESNESSHNISEYIARIHTTHCKDPYDLKLRERMKAIHQLLETMPFERRAADNKSLYHHLSRIEPLASQVSSQLLERLSTVACHDMLAGSGYQVLGSSAYYIILQGSVSTMSDVAPTTGAKHNRCVSSPRKERRIVLGPGECFGVLKVKEEPPVTQCTSVVTREPCVFLKISAADFERVVEQMKVKKYEDKSRLLKSCRLRTQWPRKSLDITADLLTWKRVKPNEVLCSEGRLAPFIGFVRQGECCVLRQVSQSGSSSDASGGDEGHNVKMGKLSAGDFFGHMSLIQRLPMKYSVVATSKVVLGIITEEKVAELDEVTVALLLHSGMGCQELSQTRFLLGRSAENIHHPAVGEGMAAIQARCCV
ncbi:cyclic nucleotide-binding domain-containing protein 1-like isoform X2 [Corticium candelabrum]|uniref:cyclic nucleotide-binding domain-containing protein 1-like isoform X2 n=1 Tax=Corticium candelabrum TaxID=121492 RepID=UPI002E264283|nr:cyclic nucleotide-binding domain-containing protein 1-like isoform X2 [Corticium candelabrum]